MKRIPPGKQMSTLNETDWIEHNQLIDQKTYFPRSISFEDIDIAVYDWFTNANLDINGTEVPVHFLTPEKWAEFKKNWIHTTDDRNTSYPYITIRRAQNPRLIQSPVMGRIPGQTFTTYKVPHYTNSGPTYKYYKVPQPIKVELDYEVRALTHYISDINIINERLLRHFASLQAYLDIDKHYMPMSIESINDESDFDNLEDERVIHTLYSITVYGYIIDEEEFEEKLGVASLLVNIEEDNA